MGTYLRVCPDCGEEYQPHMTHCIDCGSALEERLEGDVPHPQALPEPEPQAPLPPGEYYRVADGLSAQTLEPLVKLFVAARIPVKVESIGYDLRLSARPEDRASVMAILEREGVLTSPPGETAAVVVVAEGGPCPACGTHLRPGTVECPECGLLLGSAFCESCGEELSASDEACPSCGHRPDGPHE